MTSYTDHPDDRALDLYVMGDADSVLRSRVDAHLAQCDACRAREQALHSLVGAVRNVMAPLPAPHLLRRIHRSQPREVRRWRRPSRIAAMLLLMVGSAVAIAQVVAYVARQPIVLRPTPPYSGQVADNAPRPNIKAGLLPMDSIPPTRKVGARVAVSVDSIATRQVSVRALSDGRAIVVDYRNQVARLYDARLARAGDIALKASRFELGPSIAVSPFRGDSSLIVNSGATAADIVDPSGRVTRTLQWGDPLLTMPVSVAYATVSNSGFVVGEIPRTVKIIPGGVWGYSAFKPEGDSMLVFRSPVGSMRVDTVGYSRRPPFVRREPTPASVDSVGRRIGVATVSPVGMSDEVAPFSDGTIAIVRYSDYHIDWIDADGTHRSTPPVAHEWRQLSAADKTALANDVQALLARFPEENFIRLSDGQRVTAVQTPTVRTDNIPDRLPPFLTSRPPMAFATLADADGHLWIPQYPAPGAGAAAAIVFDIVDKKGKLIDRVEMPPLTVPMAFAPGLVLAIEWLGQHPGCPHPAPGTSAAAPKECLNSMGRLVSYRIR